MKSFAVLTCFVTFLLAVNVQGSIPMDALQKLTTPLSVLAAKNGSTGAQYAMMTPVQIAHLISPNLTIPYLASMSKMKISAALLTMFGSKSLADLVKFYKGFSIIPGADKFQVGILQYVTMAIQFDQPSQTVSVLNLLANFTGGGSIGQALGTTDAALTKRHYLSDVYPLLKANIKRIMNETAAQYIQKTTRFPKRFYEALLPPGAMDKILAARVDMAEAIVSGSSQELMVANRKLQATVGPLMSAITQKLSKAVNIEGMALIDATKKCNISLSTIKSKTIMQISLLCLGLPEDFPLMKMMPQQGFPKAAFQTKLTDLAKKLKMPVDSLLKLTANQVVLKFMQAQRNDPSVSDPIFYVAKTKALSIANMGGQKLFNVGMQITATSAAFALKVKNGTALLVGRMTNNTLDALPVLVKNLLGVTFNKKYFYFLSLDSIMNLLDERISRVNRLKASSSFIIPLNKASKSELANILGKTEKSLDETSIMKLLGMITGKNDQAVTSWLNVAPQGTAMLNKINLKTAEQLLGTFGIGGDVALDSGTVSQLAKNRAFPVLLMSVGEVAAMIKDPKIFNSTLSGVMNMHPMVAALVGPIAKKMGVADSMLQALTLNDVRSSMKLSTKAFFNVTVYSVLLKLSKVKISPDFGLTIRQLSTKKGVPLASLAGLTFYETMKKVTDATWQLPILIHKKKGNLTLIKVLKDGKNETETMLRVILEPKLKNPSYNYTIERLLTVLVGMDSPDTTNYKLSTLTNFLRVNMGMKPPQDPTVLIGGLQGRPFVTYVLPKLVLRINNMFRRKSFVHAYAREEFGVTPTMYDSLYKKSDGDLGKKLATATINFVVGDTNSAVNTLIGLTMKVGMDFAKRFVKKPLKEMMKACEGLSVLSAKQTLRDIFTKCIKGGLRQFTTTDKKLAKSFIYDIPLEEMKDILGLKKDYLDKNITALATLMVDDKLGPLFIPFKDAMKDLGKTMTEGRNMTLKDILQLPKFSKFSLLRFAMSKFNPGNMHTIVPFTFRHSIGQRSVEDMHKLTRQGNQDLSNATLYGILKRSVLMMKKSPCKSGMVICGENRECSRNDEHVYNCACKNGYKLKAAKCVKEVKTTCEKTKCPSDSICVTPANGVAICKCKSRWHKMKKGKCHRIRGIAIKVKKMRLKQKYRKEYGDKNSKVFKAKAAEIEAVLFNTVCKKLGCSAVVVTAINKGSLLVDFDTVFDANKNVSAMQVQSVTTAALKSPEMAVLSPDTSSKPEAQESNPCESGMADCGKNTKCVSASRGSYTCSCIKGHKKKGADCVKAGLSMVLIIVIIIVAFVIVVVIIGVVIYKMRQRRQSKSDHYGMAYDHKKESEKVQLTGESAAGGYGFSYGGGKDSETKGRLDSEEIA